MALNLKQLFDGYAYMVERHPKAARKRRVQKKWIKRFGPSIADLVADDDDTIWRPTLPSRAYDEEYVLCKE